jgi:hypothetical protein
MRSTPNRRDFLSVNSETRILRSRANLVSPHPPREGILLKSDFMKPPLPTSKVITVGNETQFKFNNLSTFQADVLQRDKMRVHIRMIKQAKSKIMDIVHRPHAIAMAAAENPSPQMNEALKQVISKRSLDETEAQYLEKKYSKMYLMNLQAAHLKKSPLRRYSPSPMEIHGR